MLKATNRKIYLAFMVAYLCVHSFSVSAQEISDWILNPTGTATNLIVDEVTKQANNAWEDFLDDKILQALSEDAYILANFPIDTMALDSIDRIFKLYTFGDGQFDSIVTRQSVLINSYVFCSPKMPIGLIGEGAVRNKIIEKIEKIPYPKHQVTSFDLLSHNHPMVENLRNIWKELRIADSAPILYYWAVLANRLDTLYPPKVSFPKPTELQIIPKGNKNQFTISTKNGQILGDLYCIGTNAEMTINSSTLLNLAAMPNALYSLDEIRYTTDYLGRVVNISYQISNSSKRKSSIKSKIKVPQILTTYGISEDYQPLQLIPKKYGGSVGRLNIVPIEKTNDNNQRKKDLTKHLDQVFKNCKKNGWIDAVSYKLEYTGKNECPNKITATCGGKTFIFINSNASQLAQINISYSQLKKPLVSGGDTLYQNERQIAPSLEYLSTINKEYVADIKTIANIQKIVTTNEKLENPENIVYIVVESMPEFPGGQQAMMRYIGENIKYPVTAQEKGIQGRVICQFVVEKDGSITNIHAVRSSGDILLDQEAIRVLSTMPRWNPGKQSGNSVRVKYTVPVNFRLQ